MAYLTATQAKDYIGGIAGNDDDALLDDIIKEAAAFIERTTGRVFEIAAATNRYFTPGVDTDGAHLYFDTIAASISTVTNGDSAVITTDQYTTTPRNFTPYYGIKLLSSAGTTWTYTDDPEGAITISAFWGHSTTPPDDILLACKEIVRQVYRSRDAMQAVTITSGGVVISSDNIPSMARAILKQYAVLT